MNRTFNSNFQGIQNAGVLSLTLIMIAASFAQPVTVFLGGLEDPLSGPSYSGMQPSSSSPTYSAFPDDDPDSGKFLGVAGSGTLPNIPIICHIGVPAGESSFDLDIFDGEIGGHWDQVLSGSDIMEFVLYEDPYKDGTGSNVVSSWYHTLMSDDDWYVRTISTTSGAQAPSGNYFYRLEIQWQNPGTSSHNNYFKIRTTGQISIAKEDKFAFMGAPLRTPGYQYNYTYPLNPPWESLFPPMDPPVWAGDPNPGPGNNDVDANSYDGDWNFYFYVPKELYSTRFMDGDADIVVDDDDANTPPIPPWNEGVHHGAPQDGPSTYDGCNIPPNIRYTISDPDSNNYVNLNPSGNMEWENFVISRNSSDNPDYLVSYNLSAGLWHMHFEGMDAHNMNFVEASFEIFTTTDPPLPVNPPPTLEPTWTSTVSPGTDVNYAHTLTNNGATDIFDLSATSSLGWTTRIYHDTNGNGRLDSSEISAGEVSNTGSLSTNESYNMIVQVVVPSTSGSTTDYLTVTGASQTEWNIQASVIDTTNVVANSPPVADANGPYYVDEGASVQLNGSGSSDPDGDTLSYHWDLDYDGNYDDSNLINPTYSWSEDGTFTVGLAVYDGQYWDYSSATVYVGNLPPEIYSTTFVYTLTQGTFKRTIPAVERPLDPTSFYNYYSASAHTGFEKPYESKIFLYRDINTDDVSLFIIHDIDGDVYYPPIGYNSGSPDAECHMDLSGIPSGAYLAQSDDPGEFTKSISTAQGRWHWWYNTDGGAIGGLPIGTSWSITITPLYWKDVNNWIYHYATGEYIALDMNQPVTISYQAQTENTTVETDEGTSITLGAFARDWGSDDEPLDYEFAWNDPYDPSAVSSGTTLWDTLFTASHTYHEDGTYYPLLTVTDSDLASDNLTFTVIVNNVKPDVIAGADQTVDEGTLLSFSGTFSDPGAYDTHTATWDWGDGLSDPGTVSEENIPPDSTGTVTGSHAYGDDGSYNVILTVQDDEGAIDVKSSNVNVNNLAPNVEPLGNYTTDENTPVTLIAHVTDPGSDDLTLTWNWGDGTSDTQAIYYNDGMGPDPYPSPGGTYPFSVIDTHDHTYGDNGVYTVTLTVEDDDSGVKVVTTVVTVLNVAPIIDSLTYSPTDESSPLTMDAHVTDPGSDDLTFTWEFEHGPTFTNIYFNNGIGPDPYPSPEINPMDIVDLASHVYGDDGVFIVTLTVTDDDGGITATTINVTVSNIAPSVDISGLLSIDENTPINLDGHATDPGSDDLTFIWDFELGPTISTTYYNNGIGDDPDPSPEINPMDIIDSVSHTYGDNGVFSVILTVEDDDGGTTVSTLNVTINNVAPVVNLHGTFIVNENSPLTLDGHGTDPGSDDLTFTWEFELGPTITMIYYNDGMAADPYPSPQINPMDVTDIVTHIYGDNGVFAVTLTVVDDDGGTTIVTTNVTVDNVAPSVSNIEAYMYVDFSLRVAGEKWHSVAIYLYEDGRQFWTAGVTRYPGDPDKQTATINKVKVDMTKSYTALVDYLPNDPRVNGNVWGGNPVWIDMTFEDGSSERLHHTFNVRQSDWGSDHWNHIDPWEVDFAPHLGGHNITFEASASDPGSDDLIFDWEFGDGNTQGPNTYFNDGISPDPPKSPEINPMAATDIVIHSYSSSGIYTITLTVTDDDGGTSFTTLVLNVVVG
ncbi:MAG: PKD domain-containing protein [Thermoplasmata archaeon]|nr:MAG: PKD domain-containing protein [Thermoplasmata archaeon]